MNYMERKVKWGFMGLGSVAHGFIEGLKTVKDAEIVAIGDLPQFYERACSFADKHGISQRYDSFEALAESDVDVIYISTINSLHKSCCLTAMERGKHVLCEKPVTLFASDLDELKICAEKNNVFFMEAMWTRFLPIYDKIKEWIDEGRIGKVTRICSQFPYRDENKEGWLYNPRFGGGSIPDVGVYGVHLALMLIGNRHFEVDSVVYKGETGVDEWARIFLKYDDGSFAETFSAMTVNSLDDAVIDGTKGRIYIPSFYKAETAYLYTGNIYTKEELVEESVIPHPVNGYSYEAEEVTRCIINNQLQSKVMTIAESRRVVEIMEYVLKKNDIKLLS